MHSDAFVKFSLTLNGPMAHPSEPDKPHGFNHNVVPQWGTHKECYSEKKQCPLRLLKITQNATSGSIFKNVYPLWMTIKQYVTKASKMCVIF